MDKASRYRDKIDPSQQEYEIDEWPFYNMARLVALYHHKLDASLKPIGIDVPRWRVLSILSKRGYATVTQISTEAVTKMSTMAKIIQRMNTEGLVVTRPSSEDARSTEVLLTEEGEKLLSMVQEKVGSIGRQAFYDISDDDIKNINRLSRKIYKNLAP